MAPRKRRSLTALVVLAAVAAVVVGVAFGLRALWTTAKQHFASDTCTIGAYDLDPSQASVAAAMVAAVTSYPTQLPERVSVLVLAAGLQESKLTNLAPGQGDRDSVGVLQQRPSQGWGGGRAEPLTHIDEATREFVRALLKIPGWRTMTVADAIQAVQISADGSAYAQHEQEAQALADGLTGRRPAAITCDFEKPTKVAAASVVAALARHELGIASPVAVDHTVRARGAHWQTAAWFVANSERLGIDKVAYAGKVWTRGSTSWRKGPTVAGTVTATMYVA